MVLNRIKQKSLVVVGKSFSLAPISYNPTLPKWDYVQRVGVISSTIQQFNSGTGGRTLAMLAGVRPGWSGAYATDRKMAKMWTISCSGLLLLIATVRQDPTTVEVWGGPSPNHAFQIHQCFVRVVRLESNSLQLRPCCNLRNLFSFPALSAFLLRHAAEPGYCQAAVSDASSRWHPVGLCQSIQFFNKIDIYIYVCIYIYIFESAKCHSGSSPVFSRQGTTTCCFVTWSSFGRVLGIKCKKCLNMQFSESFLVVLCVCADHLIQTTWTRPWHALHER